MNEISLETIRAIFERNGLGEEFREQEPLLLWPRVAGKGFAHLTEPLRVTHGVLYIGVRHHAVSSELNTMKQAYLKELNQLLDEPRLQDIRFQVLSNPSFRPKISADESGIQLNLLEREEMERILDELKDPELRAAFADLMSALAAADRTRQAHGWRRCALCGLHLLREGDQGEICFNCQLERGI